MIIEQYEQTVYGLKEKKSGKILSYIEKQNSDSEFANETKVELGVDYENEWVIDSYESALEVLLNPTSWYNSTIKSPMHNFKPYELQIVKIKKFITIEKCEDTQFLQIRLVNKDGKHYSTCNEQGVITDDCSVIKTHTLQSDEVIAIDYNDDLYQIVNIQSGFTISQSFHQTYVYKKDFIVKKKYK